MKRICLLIFSLCMVLTAQAQYDTLTISQIQTVPAGDLAACIDTSSYAADTVVTTGVLLMDGDESQVFANARNVWIQDGNAPFSGIDVFAFSSATTPDDIRDLIAGDSVRIVGVIEEYAGHETEIIPVSVSLIGAGTVPTPVVVPVADLNDAQRNNQVATGEQHEGMFIEIQNVTVTAVTFFSGGNRVSFDVADGNGNTINVSDRFLAQRLPANGGSFAPPTVGTVFTSIKGIIIHSPNGCTNANGRGYELNPFDASHYTVQAGSSSPIISAINRNPITPSSSQDANITATIKDLDGTVDTASLYYAVGVGNNNYNSIPMVNTAGDTWTATIPNTTYSDGDFVKYYICATDNDSLSACNPDIQSFDPLFFTVRDGGTTIYDVQFTPYSSGASGYRNLDVTVEGVVTASAEPNNLGYVFIQQEGGLQGWSGIMCLGNTALANLNVGDKVTVSGTVREDFGYTRLEDIVSVQTNGTGSITPVDVDPTVFTTYDVMVNEQYEGMLVNLKNSAGKVFVVDANADAPSNFAEYRVGKDIFDPQSGTRVLVGRQTSSAFGSLNCSYINDSMWINDAGILNVPACVISYEDSMDSMAGIMYYSFGTFKILPRNNDDVAGFAGGCVLSSIDDELSSQSEVVIYPVPAQEQLNIRFDFPYQLDADAKIYDMMGRVVASQAVNGLKGETQITTGQLSSGAYLFTIETEAGFLFRKKITIAQ